MLSNTLSTNEVKNAAGTEVEFSRLSTSDRKTEFAQVGEAPSFKHRLNIAHQETGSGIKQRRRSVVRIDKTISSTVDATTLCTCSAYLVVDIPVGAITSLAEPTNALAELISFVATQGDTTVLYNGTGNGSNALLSGGL